MCKYVLYRATSYGDSSNNPEDEELHDRRNHNDPTNDHNDRNDRLLLRGRELHYLSGRRQNLPFGYEMDKDVPSV